MCVYIHIYYCVSVCTCQGASRAAPGKSGLHACGEGERVLALESREGTRQISKDSSKKIIGTNKQTQ